MRDQDLSEQKPRVYDISEDPKNARRKTVLMLEDDLEFSSTLKEMLEEQGYIVTVVPSGTEGVQKVLASDFDAILCDVVMPNFPGDMFYRAVERIRPHLNKRFVFMTGHQDNPKVTEFLLEVRGTVLWKPFVMSKLFDALEAVTGRCH